MVKCEFIFDFDTDAALERIEKNKKCDEQVIIVDEQARGGENGGEIHHGGHGVENEVLQQMEVG